MGCYKLNKIFKSYPLDRVGVVSYTKITKTTHPASERRPGGVLFLSAKYVGNKKEGGYIYRWKQFLFQNEIT